ncbi:hypothetical protein LMG7974_01928 [Campylobacter majalis]|uniref:DUF7674 domain-containing protein n=1 Tax=Campylobacter majalis TaxID=2790656 RepID=A0ABM8QAG3_9BACT|nr:hypothetical protein [Campylobacter majalis]CAD7289843.1 hypothetical protein LMG7974_01928 [Campylobacter majalis]
MQLMETDLGKYKGYIYFFISKHKRYFEVYMEQIFPFDMEYIPSLLWILSAFGDATMEIFDELSEMQKCEIFTFVENGVISSDDYVATAFCTGFMESIANKKDYENIKPYLGHNSLEYAINWLNFQ